MAFYLYQASYTADAVKALISEPQNREAAAGKMIEAIGGKLHHFFFAFGTSDIVAIIEVPDEKAMVAGAMLVAASGATSGASTTKLISNADAMEAMGMAGAVAGSYTPATG
jgi:uncharacterized protein with GYD domain